MKCKDYQKLLVQLPYEELSQKEKVLLENHLKSCEKCNAELERNQQLFELTRKLRVSIPEDKDKENTIQSIFEEINMPQKIHHRQSVSYRTLRIIINTAAVFLIGLFLIQQIKIKRNLVSLQSKIETLDQVNHYQDHIPNNRECINLSENQLELLVNEYDRLLKENSTILIYLKENYPEIYQEIQEQRNVEEKTTNNL